MRKKFLIFSFPLLALQLLYPLPFPRGRVLPAKWLGSCEKQIGSLKIGIKEKEGSVLDQEKCDALLKGIEDLLYAGVIRTEINSQFLQEWIHKVGSSKTKISQNITVKEPEGNSPLKVKSWELSVETDDVPEAVIYMGTGEIFGVVAIPESGVPGEMKGGAGKVKASAKTKYCCVKPSPRKNILQKVQDLFRHVFGLGNIEEESFAVEISVERGETYDFRCLDPSVCKQYCDLGESELGRVGCPIGLTCCSRTGLLPTFTPAPSLLTPSPRLTPTPTSSPTVTPLPAGYGECGGCSGDDWGGCSPSGRCRWVYDNSTCTSNNKPAAPCCLRDDLHCRPNAPPECGRTFNNLRCNACEAFHDPPMILGNGQQCYCCYDAACGHGRPFPPRLKSAGGNSFPLGQKILLSWYAYGETPGQDNCGVQAGNIPDPMYGNCWGYLCARGTFGIPVGWRYYQVFVKGPGGSDFQKICQPNSIPDPATQGLGLSEGKTGCAFNPGVAGEYQWYVKAGYQDPGTSFGDTSDNSVVSSFVVFEPLNTPTPISPTETPIPTNTPVPSGRCQYCRMYDQQWVEITPPYSLEIGDQVYFSTAGATSHPEGNLKARFRINGAEESWCGGTLVGNWCETTLRHGDEFYLPYTFTRAGQFVIESMIFNTAVGWY